MAGIKQAIQDIMARLATLQVQTPDNITLPLFVRIWNNQLSEERKGQLESYQKPAAFVEIVSKVTWEEIGIGYRSADLGINVHLVHTFYNNDTTMEQDLTIFDLRDQVTALLSDLTWNPTGCTNLFCTSEEQDYNHDNIYHYQLTFTCNFIDSKGSAYDAAAGKYITENPPTNLQLNTAYVNDGSIPPNDVQERTFNIPK